MTRARALKQTIRARAAKTGERYTTARRHVLKSLAAAVPKPNAGPAAAADPPPTSAPSMGPTTPSAAPSSPATKGSVSDAMARRKTGHALDHWFAILDRFGGIEKGHPASARHLHDDHGLPGWYAQGITVAYERARGARSIHQRMSGEYEVSVTKTVNGDTRTVARAFTSAATRQRWLRHAAADLARSLTDGLLSPSSKGVVIRADGQGRFRYRWDSTTVQFHLLPKGTNRTSVVVTHMKLAGPQDVERRRAEWRVALAALAAASTA